MCSTGGLDDALGSIITSCQENQIPVVFALKRQLLGKVLLKKVPVSIVGIFNYDGAQVSIVEYRLAKQGGLYDQDCFCGPTFHPPFYFNIAPNNSVANDMRKECYVYAQNYNKYTMMQDFCEYK